MRVDHELVRSGWQLSTVHDGRLSAVQGSRVRSSVKIGHHEDHEVECEEECEEEQWSARNMRRSARNMRRRTRNVRVARESESGEEGEGGRLSVGHGGTRKMERQRGNKECGGTEGQRGTSTLKCTTLGR